MRFVAGRGAVAKHLVRGAAVAERHRENAGLGAVVKRLAALWRSAIRKTLPAGRCAVANSHREDANQHLGNNCERKCQCEAPSERCCPQGAAPRSSIGKPHRSERPLAREQQRGLISEISFLIFAYYDKLLTMRFAKFFSVLATVAMAGCLTAFATSPSSTAFHPEDETFSESCTTIAVGKLASSDGSIMTAHSCDSNYRTWLSMEKPVEFAPGSMDPVYSGKLHTEFRDDTKGHSMIIKYLKRGEVPAPEGPTNQYFNTAYPSMNNKALAMGEATLQSKSELINKEGILYIEELARIALQRCSTARDAIKLMGSLAEEYGYADDGECLTIIDKNEVWAFEIYGSGRIMENGANAAAVEGSEGARPVKSANGMKGATNAKSASEAKGATNAKGANKAKGAKKGKKDWQRASAIWVAQRVPDDHVYVNANTSRIGVVDFDNPDKFLYSSDIKERMQFLGLWDGKSQFKLWPMVTALKSNFGVRELNILQLLDPSLKLSMEDTEIPFSVKPAKKVTPEQMFAFYRLTYDGTEYDQVQHLGVEVPRMDRDDEGNRTYYKVIAYPISTFMPNDIRDLLNKLKPGCAPKFRTVAAIQCSYSHITRIRGWLPDELATVSYFSFDNPAQSPRIPIYASETKLPAGFDRCGQWKYTNDAAIWAYRETNKLATIRWDKTKEMIQGNVAKYEKLMMQQCEQVEAMAAQLIKEGKRDEAIELLNNFTEEFANATSKAWSNLKGEIWVMYARGF